MAEVVAAGTVLGDALWLAWLVGLIALLAFVAVPAIAFVVLLVEFRLRSRRKESPSTKEEVRIGFFHPYCDAGGGGERVLWCAVRALRTRFPAAKFVVYTGDVQSAPDQILRRAKQRFQIEFGDGDVEFVYLHKRSWVEAASYPRFTLIGQSLGSVVLGYEALNKFRPDVYIDSMGYAFTLPLFKLFAGCKTVSYVHYPTISTDMLSRVRSRTPSYNNRSSVSGSRLLSWLKLRYYRLFSFLYGCAGSFSDLTMVNSSWTEGHVSQIWGGRSHSRHQDDDEDEDKEKKKKKKRHQSKGLVVHRVYPPCDVTEFSSIPRNAKTVDEAEVRIVSVGQFRPEKDHAMQIRTMFELREIVEDQLWNKVKLVLIGGCRNAEDETRVKDLRDLCAHLSVEDNVEFLTNITFDHLKDELSQALIGLHTMWNEHFGIAVVEMLAAGLVTIAHRSGGPLMDIIVEDSPSRNGYLAIDEREYAATIAHVLTGLTPDAMEKVRERAKDSVKRFSDQQFEKDWVRTTETLISGVIRS